MKPADDNIEQRLLLAILTSPAVLAAGMLIWQTVPPGPVVLLGITIDRLSSLLE